MVECQLCNLQFKRITRTHLKTHNINIEKYKEIFPNCETISSDLRHQYGKATRENNPMNNPAIRQKVSDKLKGRVFTDTTIDKMKASANARPIRKAHSEETKLKISESNKVTRNKKIELLKI